MSEKKRRKNDGHDPNKDRQAMHAAVHERKADARIMPHTREHGGVTEHKHISTGTRSRQGTP